MGVQRPHNLRAGAEVLRYGHLEDVLVATDVEVRRLTAIETGLELVVRANRKIDAFLEVAVHVAEPHIERAVGVDVEAFIDG